MKNNKTVTRLRGTVAVRADTGSATAILAELNKTFETFKAERDEEISDLKKGLADVVKAEKVDRINAEITQLTKSLDQVNTKMASLSVGGPGGEPVNPAAAEHAKVFNTWFRRGDRAIADADLQDLQVKASLTSDSDPDGGYVVPTEMSTEIDRVLGTVSGMRSIARVMPISTKSYEKLVNVGGTASGWVGEREDRTETATAQLRKIVIDAMELYANPATTQSVLDDAAVDLAAWLADEVVIEFSEQEGDAFINGDGVNKPRGILGYPTVANASYAWGKIGFKATGVAAALSDASNNGTDALLGLYYSLKAGYRTGASWIMSDAVQETVRKFKDSEGRYMWAPPSMESEIATMMRKPVISDDNMPVVGANAFPIAFGNFQRGYMIADRSDIRVLRDPYTNKPYIHFYTTKRVGGGVVNYEAIKLLKVAA